MRALFALLLVAPLALPLQAVSLQDEARFLDAVLVAYSTTNIDAIMALRCWDGVNAHDRASCPGVLAKQLRAEERRVQSVEYCSRELNHQITNNGVVYVPNLKPIKWISVQFEPGVLSKRRLELEVGEKEGRLMIISYIPRSL